MSYAGLEKPIRTRGRAFSSRVVLGVGLGAMSALAAFALAIYVGGGFEFRFSGDRLALARGLTDHSVAGRDCMYRSPSELARGNVCRFGDPVALPRTLVWGDSFVEAALPGFESAAERRGRSFLFVGRHGCQPQTGERQDPDVSGKCRAFSAAALQVALGHPEVNDVALTLRWPASPDEATRAPFVRRLGELVAALTRAGKRVWVTGPLPIAYVNAPRALFLQSLGYARDRQIALTRAEFDANFGWTVPVLAGLVENPGVRALPLAEVFCDEVACKVAFDAHPIYFDDAHLSATGARALAGVFEATLP